MLITPQAIPETRTDLGFVSGHCVLDAGPVSAAASFLGNLFGKRSETLDDKIRMAEELAMSRMEQEARRMGAGMICNARVSISGAGASRGMIIVHVSGSAAR